MKHLYKEIEKCFKYGIEHKFLNKRLRRTSDGSFFFVDDGDYVIIDTDVEIKASSYNLLDYSGTINEYAVLFYIDKVDYSDDKYTPPGPDKHWIVLDDIIEG